MAFPTVNTSAQLASSGSVLTMAVPLTIPAGLNSSLLLVFYNAPSAANPTSVDWNGTAMSNSATNFPAPTFFSACYYLVNPDPGAFNANVNFGVFGSNRTVQVILLENATIPYAIGFSDSTTGGSTTNLATNTIGTVFDNMMVIEFLMSGPSISASTPGSGQTLIRQFNSDNSGWWMSSSYKNFATAQSVTMTESFGSSTNWQINTMEIQYTFQTTVSVSDSVTVSESVSLVVTPLLPSVNNTVTVTENTQLLLSYKPSVFDQVTLTEVSTIFIPTFKLSVFDNITITEQADFAIVKFGEISLIEHVTITEATIFLFPLLLVSVSENVTITENVQTQVRVTPSVNDQITVTENTHLFTVMFVSLFESITVSEFSNVSSIDNEGIFDTVTVSEHLTIERTPHINYQLYSSRPQGNTPSSTGFSAGASDSSLLLQGSSIQNTLQATM